MTITRRTMLAGAGLAGAGLALGACSAEEKPKAGAGSAAPGSLSGEISVISPAFTGEKRMKVYDEVVAAFNEVHPDVKVVTDHVSWSKLNEKLTVQIASGTIPDVIMSGVGWVEPFAAKEVYAEFDPAITGGREYTDKILAPCRYQDRLYALPVFLDTRSMIGNKTLWDKAGITEPPKNFEEFREAAKELTGGSGSSKQWGFMINSWGNARQTYAMALGAAGGTMFDESGTKALFNSPESLAAMEFLVGTIKDGSTTWQLKAAEGSPHPFLGGTIGISLCASAAWRSWHEGNSELVGDPERTTLFRMQDNEESIFLGGTLVSRSAQSKNAAAADAFVKHVAGPGAMQKICEVRNTVPALTEVLDASEKLKENRFVKYGVESLPYSASEGGTSAWMEIRGQINPILESALIGDTEVPAALDKANEMAQQAIDRWV